MEKPSKDMRQLIILQCTKWANWELTAGYLAQFWEANEVFQRPKNALSLTEKNEENLLDKKVGKLFQAKGTGSAKAQEHLTSSRNESLSI